LDSKFNRQYEQALSLLKKFDIDEALALFYQLLRQYPTNFDLIQQIYQLEIRKNDCKGAKRIAKHVFALENMSNQFHTIILEIYRHLRKRFELIEFIPNQPQSLINLFYHLGQTNLHQDIDILLTKLKNEQSEHPYLADLLLTYSEQLIKKNQFFKAKKELEYLMIYYTEAKTQVAAEKLHKLVNSRIRY
jgi:hypothetical protein